MNYMGLEYYLIGWNLARSNINSEYFIIWKIKLMDSWSKKFLVKIRAQEAFNGDSIN
jgi:hypothetical protein